MRNRTLLWVLLLSLAWCAGCPDEGDDDSAGDDDTTADDDDATGDDDDTTAGDDDDSAAFDDADGDGIPDDVEGEDDPDGDGVPNYLDDDSDGDGVPDATEGYGDVDGDGAPNFLDLDSDDDGLGDLEEAGDDPSTPLDSDGDGMQDLEDTDADDDGIPDNEEADHGTDRTLRDTDGDGYSDLAEITVGSDPTDAASGIDGYYVEIGSNETVLDVDFTLSIHQADVFFVLDTTCSMGGELSAMATMFAQVANQVTIPDVAFGVAEFDDYVYGSMADAATDDKPFALSQQITTDTSLVQTALTSLKVRSGGDSPESSMEALYQAASGQGFDQNCNQVYDPITDVVPFNDHFGDAFGGAVMGAYDSTVPGTGTIGGAGFREGSVPIIVYTTDNDMRDPDRGDEVPPLGCCNPAGSTAVSDSVNAISGKLIAAVANGGPTGQELNLAQLTGSLADIDADGVIDPLVFQGSGPAVVTSIISGIEALANSGEFDLELLIDDPYGFVGTIYPSIHVDVPINDTVTYQIGIYQAVPSAPHDQVFVLSMQVVADGVSVVGEFDLVLVVLADH
jgi:hypothetical protein